MQGKNELFNHLFTYNTIAFYPSIPFNSQEKLFDIVSHRTIFTHEKRQAQTPLLRLYLQWEVSAVGCPCCSSAPTGRSWYYITGHCQHFSAQGWTTTHSKLSLHTSVIPAMLIKAHCSHTQINTLTYKAFSIYQKIKLKSNLSKAYVS